MTRNDRSITRSFTVKCFFLLLIFALFFPLMINQPASAAVQNGNVPDIVLSVCSSPDSEYVTEMRINSKGWFRSLQKMHFAKGAPISQLETDVTLTLEDGSSGPRYKVLSNGCLADPVEKKIWIPGEKMKKELQQKAAQLRTSHYGILLDWETANILLPKKSVFTITDLETGLTFQAQRRAGSNHADVQPVSKKDTAIMKKIYHGRWSWDRRAILIDSPLGKVAASMHGMPHGGDGIPGNGFKGHFCVHFAGSVTHGSGLSDLAHQAMAHKAAGLLEPYLASLSPLEISDLLWVAVSQQDLYLAGSLLTPDENREAQLQKLKMIHKIRRVQDPRELPSSDAAAADLELRVSLWEEGSKPHNTWVKLQMKRAAKTRQWMIHQIVFEEK